jgi:hypothetical protein
MPPTPVPKKMPTRSRFSSSMTRPDWRGYRGKLLETVAAACFPFGQMLFGIEVFDFTNDAGGMLVFFDKRKRANTRFAG